MYLRRLISDFWITTLTYSSNKFFRFASCYELLHYLYKEKRWNLNIKEDAFILLAIYFC